MSLNVFKFRNLKKLLADGGFRGEPNYLRTPYPRNSLTPERRQFNKPVSSQRWRIEACFSRLKAWRVLSSRYRHPVEKHWAVWAVCVFLYNLDVEKRPLSKDYNAT